MRFLSQALEFPEVQSKGSDSAGGFRTLYTWALGAKLLLLTVLLWLSPGPNNTAFDNYEPHWPERGDVTWQSRLSCMDVGHYLWIAQHGYSPNNPSNAFYPLWPAVLKILGISSSPNAPIFAALTAFALWAWSMRRLYLWIQKRFGEPVAWATLLVFLLLPSSIFFWVGFTESLFLALFVTYLTGLRSINRFPALAAACLLPLARPVGICLAVIPLVEWVRGRSRSFQSMALVFFLIGFATYLSILRAATGDFFAGFHAQQYFLNSPSLSHLLEPGMVVSQFFRFEELHSPQGSMLDRMMFIGSLVLIVPASRLRLGWGAVCLAIVLIPASTNWFLSFSRFSIVAIPLWIVVGIRVSKWDPFVMRVAVAYSLIIQGWLWWRFLQLQWAS